MNMPKKIVIAIIVIFAILGIGAVFFFLPYIQSAPNAVLEVEKGTVELNTGAGWSKASSGMELKQGYYVRTLSDGETNIIFSGNSVARMENDSEVGITELKVVDKLLQVRLNQSKGNVWHSISPVSGIGSYVVDTPFGSFTEAGTSFGTNIGFESFNLYVLKGLVIRNGHLVRGNMPEAGEKLVIPFKMQMEIFAGKSLKIAPLKENSWVQKNKKADDDWLVKRREEIKRKYSTQISIAKSLGPGVFKTEITDEKINDGIDRYLRGEIDVPKLIDEGKVPEQALPWIPEEFVRQPTNITQNESVLGDLTKHVKSSRYSGENTQYVPLNWKHAYFEGRDKSRYVPPDWKHATEEGTYKSIYVPQDWKHIQEGRYKSQYVPFNWTHAYLEGPDKSKYVPPDWTHAYFEGPDKSRYVPPDYKHAYEEGPDKSRYVPPDWKHAYEEGPDKSSYLPGGYIHFKDFDKSKYKYVHGISDTEAPTPTPATPKPTEVTPVPTPFPIIELPYFLTPTPTPAPPLPPVSN